MCGCRWSLGSTNSWSACKPPSGTTSWRPSSPTRRSRGSSGSLTLRHRLVVKAVGVVSTLTLVHRLVGVVSSFHHLSTEITATSSHDHVVLESSTIRGNEQRKFYFVKLLVRPTKKYQFFLKTQKCCTKVIMLPT